MIILDGKKVADEMKQKLKVKFAELLNQGVKPKLVIVQVGDDPASLSYVKGKIKACDTLGIEGEILKYAPDEVTTESLIKKVIELNIDASVNGILIQMPLPEHIYYPEVFKAMSPYKDVDGFTAYNLGKTFLSTDFEELAPPTPLGIIRLFEHYGIEVMGKEAVIVGVSNLVGKPLTVMLLNRRATVTTCHSKTKDLGLHTRKADILIVAVGKPFLITADMVKKDTIVVDVGINKTTKGKLIGDVDFENVAERTSYITPVPGGVGPMTVACLMENMYKAVKKQIKMGQIKVN
ncbi:bifunctional 5,10-methylenetetrahydrofolate dehydrogenase/5,10-methenyltetrahydrofolate cyclohydrolase [Candidatus Gracilibacteria bacterium]|nr:bifunctional 5,10-methylenetetrahydrofolate dehydrogenase/5,10-methenyltetrahydrofolate cyclohydrolase [Candidatus Gracilibacteria bacterium]